MGETQSILTSAKFTYFFHVSCVLLFYTNIIYFIPKSIFKMHCFLCKNEFISSDALVLHLKVFHNTVSNFECIESSCSQSFNNTASFKKHLKRKHEQICESLAESQINEIANQSDNEMLDSSNEINCLQLPESNENTQNNSLAYQCESNAHSSNNINEISSNSFQNHTYSSDTHNTFTTKSLNKSIIEFSLTLHDNNNFNRKNVHDIQQLVTQKLFDPAISALKQFISEKSLDNETDSFLNTFINLFSSPFEFCKSDFLLNKWLKEHDLSDDVLHFNIHETIGTRIRIGEAVYDEITTKGVLMPLKFQFKKYFEKGQNLMETLHSLENIRDDENLSSFIDGKLWKQKISLYENDICIPYNLYFDEFEVNNPLGTHCQPILGIYYNFPLSHNISKLKNIFIAGFIKSLDLKNHGNDASFKHLVNVLISLEEEGLTISTSEGDVFVRFILCLILGYNLGINCICDFIKSFSSNFFCRFCKMPKNVTHYSSVQVNDFMRSIENYNVDVTHNSSDLTGITQESILNNIKSFHVVENYSVDMMHDLFEGICHYDLCHITKYFTYIMKIFSLETLNVRKQNFNYGCIETGNYSKPIALNHLNRYHLKMTASEMKNFVHFFPLIIGDLIPENDDVWNFFLTLLKIIDLLLQNSFSADDIILLRQLIDNHNKKYVELFKDTLKPKHHILTHYPTIIEFSGPPKLFWCFRFESKHKEVKAYANSTTSRKNIPLTLARKCQLKFAHFLMSPDEKIYSYSLKHQIASVNKLLVFEKLKIQPQTQVIVLNQIEYKGTNYKTSLFLTTFDLNISFFEIKEIFLLEENSEIILLVDEILVSSFSSHFDAYEIDKNKTVISENLVFNIKKFKTPPINIHKTIQGCLMIRLKEYF